MSNDKTSGGWLQQNQGGGLWLTHRTPGQNGRYFDIFLDENDRIPIQISLRYVPRSPIDDKPEMVQVMA